MKSAAIISKPSKTELAGILPELRGWFRSHGYQLYLDQETAQYTNSEEIVPRKQNRREASQFCPGAGRGWHFCSSAARSVAHEGVPILAVNLGSLGFLTEVPLSEMYLTLEAVDSGLCPREERSVLDCSLFRGGACLAHHFALNDAVVNKSAISRLIDFGIC